MAGVKHFSSGIFYGTHDDCVLEFFENFELIATAHGWSDHDKLVNNFINLKTKYKNNL